MSNSTPKRFVILPCAGIGRRMGGDQPKFLMDLGGMTVLGLTLKQLHDCKEIDQILLVIHPHFMEEFSKRYLFEIPHSKVSYVISGGKERQDSIWHGLQCLKGSQGDFQKLNPSKGAKPLIGQDQDLVAVHDAVRPFASSKMFTQIFQKAQTHGGAIIATPAKDTIKEKTDDLHLRTLNREKILQAQTPQAFKLGLLIKAYENAYEKKLLGTDDASLVEALGHPIKIVMGNVWNLKITTPEDLIVARALWQNKEKKD